MLWGWRRWLAAALAGAAASFALPPFDFPAAGFLAFPVLVWLLDGAVAERRRWVSFVSFFTAGSFFGFGYFLVGMGWVGAPFARIETPVSFVIATIGIPAGLALFYGFAALLARTLWTDGVGRIAALAFAFAMAEWLRMTLLSGFAWNAIGYALMPLPVFMQAVQLVGLVGMTAAAVFVFAAPALIGTQRHMVAGLALAVALVAAQTGYGYVHLASQTPSKETVAARLVKPDRVNAKEFETTFQTYRDLTAAPSADETPKLILWPENAVPFVLTDRGDVLTALAETLQDGQVLVLGTKRRGLAGNETVHDAVTVVADDGEILDAADKKNSLLLQGVTSFEGGKSASVPRLMVPSLPGSPVRITRPLKIDEGLMALPLVGGEATIPGIAGSNGVDTDLILSLSDYAVFDGTPAPYQNLRQAQIRAVEAGRPLLLSTPSGIAAAIDSRGRIIAAMGPANYGALDVSLPVAKKTIIRLGNKFYVGLTFAAFFGMFALLLSIHNRLM